MGSFQQAEGGVIVGSEPSVDVIVTNHNYSSFLDCALESIRCQSQGIVRHTVVVDDASDSCDVARDICHKRGIRYVRTEFKSPHLARGAGFAVSSSPIVCFLDADNYLDPDYLSEAVRMFESDSRLAIVYPDLRRFGDGCELFRVPEFEMARLEQENFIDTGSVWLRDAIDQVSLFDLDVNGWEDWWSARQIMRSAPWVASKNSRELNYRIHPQQRTRSSRDKSYFSRAQLVTETVTIFLIVDDVSACGRRGFERLKKWIETQLWPRRQLRILIANTSQGEMPVGWLEGLDGVAGLSWYDHRFCNKGASEAAVYNRMLSEASTEFVLSVGPQLCPELPDTIERLLRAFDVKVCAVSADASNWGASLNRSIFDAHPSPLGGDHSEVENVSAAGFECLMIRRSQVVDEVIKNPKNGSKQFDEDWFCRLNSRGRACRVNWSVPCNTASE
jgi:glycosyltransferase involved in cell wall biosynthesis